MAILGSDAHQLDRLGRELKCPICLSLFKQAASLTCNHTFCRGCILQSMKNKPACPICKVHTTRREVRAAPQMDNLVAIFVSMGSAAGLDVMASQNVPITIEPVQAPTTAKGATSRGRPALSNIINRQQSLESPPKQNLKSPDYTFKGAIPAKKRIQVPQPSSLKGEMEPRRCNMQCTPLSCLPVDKCGSTAVSSGSNPSSKSKRQSKRKGSPNEMDAVISPPSNCKKANKRAKEQVRQVGMQAHGEEKETLDETATNMDKSLPKVKSCRKKKGNDMKLLPCSQLAICAAEKCSAVPARDDLSRRKLDPFFWVREDSSQDTDAIQVTQLTLTQSTARPNFSDLKDSDNELDLDANEEITNDIGVCGPDSYDSDDFDWTQHPCSPELRCSPSKNQGPQNDIVINLPLEAPQRATQGISLNGERDSRDMSSKILRESAFRVAPTFEEDLSMIIEQDKGQRKSGRNKAKSRTHKAVHLSVRDVSTPQNKDSEQQYILAGGSCEHQNQPTLDIVQPDEVKQINPSSTGIRSIEKASKPQKKRIFVQKAKFDAEKDNVPSKVPNIPRSVNEDSLSKGPEKSNSAAEPQLSSCVFCRDSNNTQVTGPMMHYSQHGVSLRGPELGGKIIHVHKHCAEWAPDVYFVEDEVKNLNAEAARGLKIKCNSCGKKGAALGCCLKRCRRSYHYPCARTLSCRWDEERFILLCPEHKAERFPVKKTRRRVSSRAVCNVHTELQGKVPDRGLVSSEEAFTKWACGQSSKWVLCGSALDSAGKDQLASFAIITGATVSKAWSSNVTHVIAGTDLHGAARRTMKFLMAILEGKWILKLEWLAACIEAGKPVGEEPFEIGIDIHGTVEGPKQGRLISAGKASKLFAELQFYLLPDFLPSYKVDLQALVVAGGGEVLHRKPVTQGTGGGQRKALVVYNNESPSIGKKSDVGKLLVKRQAEAKGLAASVGAHVVPHQWILDSIASSKVEPLD